jgi:hypothetical protein
VTEDFDEKLGQKIHLLCEFADSESNDLTEAWTSSWAILK